MFSFLIVEWLKRTYRRRARIDLFCICPFGRPLRKSNRTRQNSGRQKPRHYCMIRVPDFSMRNISACPVTYDKSQSLSCQGNRPWLIILSVDGMEAHSLRRRRFSFRQRRPRPPELRPHLLPRVCRCHVPQMPFARVVLLVCNAEERIWHATCGETRHSRHHKGKPTLIITTDATRRGGMELMVCVYAPSA